MQKNVRIVTGGIVIVLLAAGFGFGIGKYLSNSSHTQVASTAATSKGEKKGERKILYYRNPMGLPDTSPVPKKDTMGMDYIPVYEGEDESDSAGQVRVNTAKVQKLGVRTEKAALRGLGKTVRTTGRIEPNERRIFSIAPKFDGYVERLYVNTTGQAVSKGQPLFAAYSPELVSAQREYVIAVQGLESLKGASEGVQEGMKQLANSSLMRLKNWDISPGQIKALARNGEAKQNLVFHSPASGIVTEKKALQGMRFMPGESLFQITDLSSVWVIADIFEQDIGQLEIGGLANVNLDAYPTQTFKGKIDYIYPTLNPETRSVQVRIVLKNPDLQLKPAMYAHVELPTISKGKVLVIPDSAVIDSGTRQVAFVRLKEGRFEPREVKLGNRSEQYIEVLEGVSEGEEVVVSANFLIDAESNLKAALGSFTQPKEGASKSVGHHATGTLDEFDSQSGSLVITHEAISSLNWPAMTMEFVAANDSIAKDISPGMPIDFEFVERKPGEWVVTNVKPASAKAGMKDTSQEKHTGH